MTFVTIEWPSPVPFITNQISNGKFAKFHWFCELNFYFIFIFQVVTSFVEFAENATIVQSSPNIRAVNFTWLMLLSWILYCWTLKFELIQFCFKARWYSLFFLEYIRRPNKNQHYLSPMSLTQWFSISFSLNSRHLFIIYFNTTVWQHKRMNLLKIIKFYGNVKIFIKIIIWQLRPISAL